MVLCAAAGSAAEGWFRAVEVGCETSVEDKLDVTVRFTPCRSHECSRIVFDCFYHQEFPWEDIRGRQYTKIHEPVSFQYQRDQTKFVNDLDVYVSFRVPVGRALLESKYGPKTFNKDSPITVTHLRVTGYADDKPLWTYDLPSKGKLDTAALEAQKDKKEPGLEEERDPSIKLTPPKTPASGGQGSASPAGGGQASSDARRR
jgi:hypothetical protein